MNRPSVASALAAMFGLGGVQSRRRRPTLVSPSGHTLVPRAFGGGKIRKWAHYGQQTKAVAKRRVLNRIAKQSRKVNRAHAA